MTAGHQTHLITNCGDKFNTKWLYNTDNAADFTFFSLKYSMRSLDTQSMVFYFLLSDTVYNNPVVWCRTVLYNVWEYIQWNK